MGHYRHHVIIIVPETEAVSKRIYKKAVSLFGKNMVSKPLSSPINGYKTIYIGPDGAKEGSEESDEYDKKRERFLNYLNFNKSVNESAYVVMTMGRDSNLDTDIEETTYPIDWKKRIG